MVNNSTNINKTNRHLNSLNTRKTPTYDIGNPGPGLEQIQQCQVKSINGLPTLPFLIIGSPKD
jgi:hypothetical protein